MLRVTTAQRPVCYVPSPAPNCGDVPVPETKGGTVACHAIMTLFVSAFSTSRHQKLIQLAKHLTFQPASIKIDLVKTI